jgi:phospholipid/cholesterol/gamma-HCH transport system ATP-binding protein
MIVAKSVHKTFGGHHVLKGVDISVADGKTHVILGRSGCGKSVLLKHLLGLIKPDTGAIMVNGLDLARLDESQLNKARLQFGMVFQGAALFDSLTIEENVGFLLYEFTELNRTKIRAKVKELLRLVGLGSIEDKKPHELSGGMRKRVAIARALCLNPSVLMYDEPTTGVDPIGSDMINALIKDLNKKLGVTSIVITHDLASAFDIAHHISFMFDGRILLTGTSAEVKATTDPHLMQFLTGNRQGPIGETDV